MLEKVGALSPHATVNIPFSFLAPVGGAAPARTSLGLVAASLLSTPCSCLSVVPSLWLNTLV